MRIYYIFIVALEFVLAFTGVACQNPDILCHHCILHGGYPVTAGQTIGQIVDPLRGRVLSTVTSPVNGYLFTIRAYPIVYEGSLMARIFNSEEQV